MSRKSARVAAAAVAEPAAEKAKDEELAPKPKRAPKKAAAAAAAVDSSATASTAVATPAPAKAKGGTKRKAAEVSKANDDDDDGDEEEIATVTVKGRAAVDSLVPGHASYHVYEEGADVYNATLNQTNIGNNNNKYYVIQLLQHDSTGNYFTWNRWGRVGHAGQNKLTSFGKNLAGAKADFMKKFKDKTVNQWAQRKSFVPRAGKYTLIEIDYGDPANADEPATKKALARTASSTLPKSVQDLMALIFDMKMMEKQMIELKFDVKKQPLGRLSKSTLKQGYEVLSEIEAAIKGGASGSDLSVLSSRFYTLVPHIFGMKVPTTINTLDMLNNEIELVEALTDIEVAATVLKSTGGGSQIDANYAKLGCHIEPIDSSSDEYKRIEEYVKNTYHHGKAPKIVNVFALERQGEHDRFAEKGGKIGNRKLLWHGSRLTNFVGILSQGLRIAPPEAPASGYRFGKGLYFADMCGLSAMYCRTYGSEQFCMLLADVAMGEPAKLQHDQFMTSPLPRTHSTLATGSEAPSSVHHMKLREPKLGTKKLDLTVEVPLGKPKPTGVTNTSVRENQYIVYDVAQAKLQYLVQMTN